MILIPLASLMGILLGILVAHIAKEELDEGERYIRSLRSFLLLIMLVALFLTLPFPSRIYQLAYGLLLLVITVTEILTKKPFHIPTITPLLLFISLFFVPQEFVLINSSLFLLVGLPLGTEAYHVITQSREKS